MAESESKQKTQQTPKGHEIPVPKRKEVMEFFKGVTGKRPAKQEQQGDSRKE